jgi:hypothetical protein
MLRTAGARRDRRRLLDLLFRSKALTFMSKRVLLTTVCRPMGPKYGDAPSVGYELLYGQVTRAQGLFSPRTVNIHFFAGVYR